MTFTEDHVEQPAIERLQEHLHGSVLASNGSAPERASYRHDRLLAPHKRGSNTANSEVSP